MYEYNSNEKGQRLLVETLGSPQVYFDTWAFDHFSEDADARIAFVESLNTLNGTLRISNTNIAELQKRDDKNQLAAIYELIDSVDSGLINTYHNDVVKVEDHMIRDRIVGNASSDTETVRMFLMSQNYPENWKMSELIRPIGKSVAKSIETDWDNFSKKMHNYLQEKRKNRQFKDSVNRHGKAIKEKGTHRGTATQEITDLAYNFILQNEHMSMPGKEWLDLMHTVVPVAYCDHVLIDKRWVSFVRQCGFSHPDIANVYSKKELDQFLDSLKHQASEVT